MLRNKEIKRFWMDWFGFTMKREIDTDLGVFSSEADVVDPRVLYSKVLWDVNGEVVNVGKTSDPTNHERTGDTWRPETSINTQKDKECVRKKVQLVSRLIRIMVSCGECSSYKKTCKHLQIENFSFPSPVFANLTASKHFMEEEQNVLLSSAWWVNACFLFLRAEF